MAALRSVLRSFWEMLEDVFSNIKCCKNNPSVGVDDFDEDEVPLKLILSGTGEGLQMKRNMSHSRSFYNKSNLKTTSTTKIAQVPSVVQLVEDPERLVVVN